MIFFVNKTSQESDLSLHGTCRGASIPLFKMVTSLYFRSIFGEQTLIFN